MIKLLLSTCSALMVSAIPALSQEVRGRVIAVEGEGRTVIIEGDRKIAISNSGTTVVIKKAPGDRAKIAVGMTCIADAEKATTITCE